MPPPFVPGECTAYTLEPTSQCTDPRACPVELAGEVDCSGLGHSPSLAFDGAQLYGSLIVSPQQSGPFALLGLRIDPVTAQLAVHAVEKVQGGFLRLDGATPVLLSNGITQLERARADAGFEQFTAEAPVALSGALLDAHYDSRGELHVWTRTGTSHWSTAVFARDGTTVFMAASAQAMALGAGDREAAAFFVPGEASAMQRDHSIALWAPGAPQRMVATLSNAGINGENVSLSLAPYAPAPSGWLVSANLNGRLFAYGAGSQGTALFGERDGGYACTMQMTVQAPAFCPSKGNSTDLGEQVVSHGVVADERAGPWLVALLADATVQCSWYSAGGCFESMPCYCMQAGRTELRAPEIALRSLSEQVQTWRLPLTDLPVGQLAYTPLADGRLFVAYAYEPLVDGAQRTRLRYFALRLAPSAPP